MPNPLIDRQGQSNEEGIVSQLDGGLNLSANGVNVPYADSTVLLNCDFNSAGNITKRKGTKILSELSSSQTKGFSYFNFITGLQYSYLIEKDGLNINIYELSNGNISFIFQKANVWTSAALGVIPSFTRTSEINPRVIACTGVNKPIQLTFTDSQRIANSTEANFTFSNLEDSLYNCDATNLIVYKNNIRQTFSSITYPAFQNNLVINGVSVVSGDIIDIVKITWQHLVEGLFLKGSDFIGRTVRNNETQSDQNVQVPISLSQQDIELNYGNSFQYGYVIYKNDNWDFTDTLGHQFDYSNTQSPADADTWASGNGSVYDSTGGGSVIPSPNFITFGSIRGSGTTPPEEIIIVKRFNLLPYFNGGFPLSWDEFSILVDGGDSTGFKSSNGTASVAANSPATFQERLGIYYLLDADLNVGISGDDDIKYMTFEAGDPIGLNESSEIELIYSVVGDFIGSAATTSTIKYIDGSACPFYGAGYWFDYLRGVFPRYVSLFENRLVFSGISNNPLQLLFSEVGDSTIPLQPYRKLQIRLTDTLSTDPIDYRLSSSTDDYITGMAVWQRSLIAFTKNSVFVVQGSNESGLSPISIFSQLVSNQGLINDRSWCFTDDSLLYLSIVGLQRIDFGLDSDSYLSSEVSIKLRPVFNAFKHPDYLSQSFVVYDSSTRKIFMGLPVLGESTDYTKKLFVYDIFRKAWSEYSTDGTFKIWSMLQYFDSTEGETVFASCQGWDDVSDSSNKLFIKFNDSYYLDYRRTTTGTGNQLILKIPIQQSIISFTSVENQQTYYLSEEVVEERHFNLFSNDDVQDIHVTFGNNILVFGSDYVKHHLENSIEIIGFRVLSGFTITISKRTPSSDSVFYREALELTDTIKNHKPVHVVSDNVALVFDRDFTVSDSIGDSLNITTINHPRLNANVYYGKYYESRYTSPLLAANSLANLKRGKHIYLNFDNSLGLDQWKTSDINTASNQDLDEIFGFYKQKLNANVEIYYNDDVRGDSSVDLYQFYSTTLDFSQFDVADSPNQSRQQSLFKEALLGIGVNYRFSVWSYDETTFTIVSWQVTKMIKGDKYVNFAF